MSKLLFICAFSAIISLSLGQSCTSPKIESTKSFTTEDATIVSQIAFISKFKLKCGNRASETSPLFAEVDGKLSPVVRVGIDEFQVSFLSPQILKGIINFPSYIIGMKALNSKFI